MNTNVRTMVMGGLAFISIGIGGVLTLVLSRGCAKKETPLPVQNVPDTVDPDYVFSAPETLPGGGVKSVRRSWPDGSDRLVLYYTAKGGKKVFVSFCEYYGKGVKKRIADFDYRTDMLIIEDRAWYPDGNKKYVLSRKVAPLPVKGDIPPDSGVFHGPYEEYWPNGVPRTRGSYRNGEREGIWHEWSRQNIRMSTAEYEGGKLDGIFRKWRVNGYPEVTGTYNNGKRTGKWTFFNADGSVARTEDYPEETSDV